MVYEVEDDLVRCPNCGAYVVEEDIFECDECGIEICDSCCEEIHDKWKVYTLCKDCYEDYEFTDDAEGYE